MKVFQNIAYILLGIREVELCRHMKNTKDKSTKDMLDFNPFGIAPALVG